MAGSVVSGSENWEVYTEDSEADEADARDAYYAKVKSQQMRAAPKRLSSGPTMVGDSKRLALDQNLMDQRESPVESDANWTDLGEVF